MRKTILVDEEKLADLILVARWVTLSFVAGLKEIPSHIASDALSGLSIEQQARDSDNG